MDVSPPRTQTPPPAADSELAARFTAVETASANRRASEKAPQGFGPRRIPFDLGEIFSCSATKPSPVQEGYIAVRCEGNATHGYVLLKPGKAQDRVRELPDFDEEAGFLNDFSCPGCFGASLSSLSS